VVGDAVYVLHYVTTSDDVIRSRDVIGHMTVRISIDDFLYVLNRNQTRISLSFHFMTSSS